MNGWEMLALLGGGITALVYLLIWIAAYIEGGPVVPKVKAPPEPDRRVTRGVFFIVRER